MGIAERPVEHAIGGVTSVLRRRPWQIDQLRTRVAQITRRQLAAVLACALVASVPVGQFGVLLWSIWNKTAHVPWWDEFKMTVLAEKWDARTLTLGDLWSFHNEHRPFLPRTVDLIILEQTHWNRQIEMSIHLLIGAATLALVASAVATTVRNRALWVPLVVPVSLLVLSFGQSENWLWGWQLGFIGICFGVAVCLRALVSNTGEPVGWKRYLLAMLGASVATLSSAGGLMAWVGFLPSVWRMGYKRFALWAITGAFVWYEYFQGFHRVFTTPQPLSALITYGVTWLGAPVGAWSTMIGPWSTQVSFAVALISIVVMVINLGTYWYLRRTLAPLTEWISLAVYALGVGAITAYGRTALGIGEALSWRYQGFSSFWWVAVLVIGVLTAQQVISTISLRREDSQHAALLTLVTRRWSLAGLPRGAVAVVASGLLVVSVMTGSEVATNLVGLHHAYQWQYVLKSNEWCVLSYKTAPTSCVGLYDDLNNPVEKTLYLHGLQYMQKRHLNIFYDPSDVVFPPTP